MTLSADTRLFELLERYPFLVDYLANFNPAYTGLTNPVLRNTLGRMASLRQVARVGKVPVDELLAALQAAIKASAGDWLEIITTPTTSTEERQEVMKQLIRDLHAGQDMEEIKSRFMDLLVDVSPADIAAMEQALIAEGMPEEEIRRLCDVHVQVMQPALDGQALLDPPLGHPVHTFMLENREFEWRTKRIGALVQSLGIPPDEVHFVLVRAELAQLAAELARIDIHYTRKEHQLFPYLEKHGVTAPPKVMWAIHDDIRAKLKELQRAVRLIDLPALASVQQELGDAILAMIFKEEQILFPMANDLLSEAEWHEILRGEHEIGYALIEPAGLWQPEVAAVPPLNGELSSGLLTVETGALTLEQLNLIITHLPFEMSFIDEHDEVRFYSNTPERLFPRSPAVIGRKVQNCHPAKSLHLVQAIIDDFRAGKQRDASFWIPFQEQFLLIRYFAVHDAGGSYRGALEVVQEISGIQQLNGERRLPAWSE